MTNMMIIESTRHQVAIAGQVIDKQTGWVIAGARVEISSSPPTFEEWLSERKKQYGDGWEQMEERADRVRTAADGHFHFVNLPGGQYTLTASLLNRGSRYGTAQSNVAVSVAANGDVTMAIADIALPPTTIKGKVTKQGDGVITLAEVKVKGSGERVFTNSKGEYLLTGLEKGERTVLVSAQGCKTGSQTTQLTRGAVKTLDFVLLPPAS
ncbi:MAG: carboxypeptidase-like regulatory domain-containing protein [Proteobacteria bacterium]|nr:carboxypeptidase-like regulatory domain-containing protein [Pseudomonadota bacterium]MBU1420142.1 carboxypeptidase-like regulatory domain-containing protein [Pseudomonadota bacterium]MBU1455886.1 carboxypeptidase-like regulatory domain-containing protein [Pseudomonadota bacterium]